MKNNIPKDYELTLPSGSKIGFCKGGILYQANVSAEAWNSMLNSYEIIPEDQMAAWLIEEKIMKDKIIIWDDLNDE